MAPTHEPQQARLLRLAKRRGLLRARDLAAYGLPTIALTRLVQAGKLERIDRGMYGIPGAPVTENHSLAEVALRVPKGVICLISALRVHDIGTQAPFAVWLAIPHRAAVPKLTFPRLRIVRMSDRALADGVHRIKVDGVSVPVFGAARTVVDAFRFRNKIGLDVAIEALRDGWSRRRFTMGDLWRHAEANRILSVMRPYMETIAA
ncbi:MAG TPA: type IV toxin-antitoxin system AbiEi family antitoxin domain-containing protein [Burkholderiaceae bacterium]|nr:type IV toxin-antitoxin system AbiEi family antitoxin domain-containing protein [Burkholderiaceae bacterium]